MVKVQNFKNVKVFCTVAIPSSGLYEKSCSTISQNLSFMRFLNLVYLSRESVSIVMCCALFEVNDSTHFALSF